MYHLYCIICTVSYVLYVFYDDILKTKNETQAGCEAFYDGEEEIGTEDHAGYTQAIQPYFLCISLFLFYVKFYLF